VTKKYVGNDRVTLRQEAPAPRARGHRQRLNKRGNRIRYVIEQVIPHLKKCNILRTDYRRPLHTFEETISTVIALHFYQIASITLIVPVDTIQLNLQRAAHPDSNRNRRGPE
jgi:hypothetical protein